MILLTQRIMLTLGLWAIFTAGTARATGADQLAATIGPYLDDQTILVAHVDLSRIDVDAALEILAQVVPIEGELQSQVDAAAVAAKAWLATFQKAGGRDLYAALSIADIGHRDAPDIPFYLVLPVAEGGNTTALEGIIPTNKEKKYPFQVIERIPADGPLVVGSRVVLERLKSLRSEQQARDKYLADALAAAGDSAMQIVFTPTDDHRRVIREMFPKLPKPFDAIDGQTLADGMVWKGVGIDLSPQLSVRSVVGSSGPDAAERLAASWIQLLEFAVTDPKMRQLVPWIDRIVPLLQPTVDGDRVSVTLRQDSVMPIVQQMLLPVVKAARSSALRSKRMNQFKHLALAMHNWADSHRKKVEGKRPVAAFPPAAIHGADGKPLLSWRVAVLPYLDQQSLYEKFHLDEPWDSEHNKGLIEKMPDLFKDHELASALNPDRPAPGETTYVVPVGKGLVFGRSEGTALSEITDGTSHTIMIVEVVPELAVPWTKPADWAVDRVEIDPKTNQITQGDPLQGVRKKNGSPFAAARCDGSVHIIASDIDPNTFWHLLTRAGRETVGDY